MKKISSESEAVPTVSQNFVTWLKQNFGLQEKYKQFQYPLPDNYPSLLSGL